MIDYNNYTYSKDEDNEFIEEIFDWLASIKMQKNWLKIKQ